MHWKHLVLPAFLLTCSCTITLAQQPALFPAEEPAQFQIDSPSDDAISLRELQLRLDRLERDNQELRGELQSQRNTLSQLDPATVEMTDAIFAEGEVEPISHEFQMASSAGSIVPPPPGSSIQLPANCGIGSAAATKPKYPTVALTGFAQIDAVYFDQDASNSRPVAAGGYGDLQDFAGFRRARLAAKGQIAENVGYLLEMDFATAGRPSFMDVWVEAQKIPILGTVRIGQFRQPFSMESWTSVRDLTFLERSLPFQAFDPFRQIGVMAYNSALDDRIEWAYSGYRFPTDVWGNAFGDSGYGFATRITGCPVYDKKTNTVVHVGGGYVHENPGNSFNAAGTVFNNAFQFRSIPEVGFTDGDFFSPVSGTNGPFVAATGIMSGIKDINIFNLEYACSYQSFIFQSEVFLTQLQLFNGDVSNYQGTYAQASYLLTGEQKGYTKKTGTYSDRIVPFRSLGRCGWGAWEVAGRWSYLDLTNAPTTATNPITPLADTINNLTLGVNWYWNANSKMQFNYIRVMQNVNTASNYSNMDIYAVRTQFDF